MPFINMPLEDAAELEVVPEGEYELQIVKAEDGESKKGNEMTTVFIKVLDSPIPNANLIKHWITYPTADTPEDQKAMRILDITRFLTCFGIPFEGKGFNSDDLAGATARCLVIQEQADDGNTYNRLRLPRLKKKQGADDVAAASSRRRR